MNFVADESVDQPIVAKLRQDGHDIVYVAELSPSASDDDVLQQANQRSAVLLNADKDFGEVIFRQHRLQYRHCPDPIARTRCPQESGYG
jgi:hypothetical protein